MKNCLALVFMLAACSVSILASNPAEKIAPAEKRK